MIFLEKGSLKGQILDILSNQWPLSTKRIYNIIKSKRNISYQAVHKAINELVEENIILKTNKEYQFNLKWIESYGEFLENVKSNYFMNTPIFFTGIKEFRQEGDTHVIIFDSLAEAEKYRKQIQWSFLSKKGKKVPYCAASSHLKSPIIYSEKSLRTLNIINKIKTPCYLVISGKTPIDEWCANYYRSKFVKVITGVSLFNKCDVMILGDIITQLYIPNDICRYTNNIYGLSNDISSVNIPEFYKNVYEKKIPVKFIIFKNMEIANQLRKQILKCFENKIAVFDIDGTLINGILIYDFSFYMTKNKKFDKIYFTRMNKALMNYKKGLINYDILAKIFVESYAKGLKGISTKETAKMAEEFIRTKINIFPYSIKIFNMLKRERKTLAISASSSEILNALKKIFGFDFIISTELETKECFYTGKIKLNLSSKEMKMREFMKFIDEKGIDMSNSVGIGDTHHDVAFLDLVKNPVIVNPNNEISEIAKKKKWPIFEKPYDNLVNYIERIS